MAKTKLTGKRLMEDLPQVREGYQLQLGRIQTKLALCKRGTLAQIARELETSPSWLCQVLSGNRISTATATFMEVWLEQNLENYRRPQEKTSEKQTSEKEMAGVSQTV